MSRVHDALRKAEQFPIPPAGTNGPVPASEGHPTVAMYPQPELSSHGKTDRPVDLVDLLSKVRQIPFDPAPELHLIDGTKSHEMPGEEFRSLRTRLNHLKGQQRLTSLVITSASPAEGKTFTAVNLALVQAQLSENAVLLADIDLRRPTIHSLFQTERTPGFSDYILGDAPLEQCIRKVGNTNLYFMPAGTPVKNPLELLNLRHVRTTIEALPRLFNWFIIDSPPLLFSADANLLSTLTDGTVIVVRIGATTFDNITRATQTLCENNVVGIVVNGARATELYSKYTYYYSKHD